jgi:amylosucrase
MSVPGRIFQGLQRLIVLRKQHPVFSGNDLQVMNLGNPSVLGYVRSYANERVLILANFSEHPQTIPANLLRLYGLNYTFTDLLRNASLPLQNLVLEPLGLICLQ